MILVASTALIVSTGSVIAARKASSNQVQTLKPDLSKEIKEMFPSTTELMPKFERHVQVRKDVGIEQVSRSNLRFIRQFPFIAEAIVSYIQHPGEVEQKQVKKLLGKFWYPVDSYYLLGSRWAEEQYLKAVKLQKDGFSDEFLDITSRLIDCVYAEHIENTINRSSQLELSSITTFGLEYDSLVKTQLEQLEAS